MDEITQKLNFHCKQTQALKDLGFNFIVLGGYRRRIYALPCNTLEKLSKYATIGGIALPISIFPAILIQKLEKNIFYKIKE